MKNGTILASAIAATLGAAGQAEAANIGVMLQSVVSHSSSGTSAANISSSTATWSYDTDTGLLTQLGGLFNARYTISPSTTLFRHSTTGLVIGGGLAASATSYVCTEGNFGGNVGASLCGNYSFGANLYNESTAAWGPGTAASRTLGGDDMGFGDQQSVGIFNGITQISWVGTTLTLSNATPNSGYTWILDTGYVPTPPLPGLVIEVDEYQNLLGISNLDIAGTRYDVRFTCGYTGSPCPGMSYDTFFGNGEAAAAAADAINGALAATGHGSIDNIFSEDPWGGAGIYQVAFSPTNAVQSCSSAVESFGVGAGCGPYYEGMPLWTRVGTTAVVQGGLAVFSLTAVPLPAAAWLFGGALLALRTLKRRA